MRLIDRISLNRTIKMLLDFILSLVDKFKKNTQETEKKRRKRRKANE